MNNIKKREKGKTNFSSIFFSSSSILDRIESSVFWSKSRILLATRVSYKGAISSKTKIQLNRKFHAKCNWVQQWITDNSNYRWQRWSWRPHRGGGLFRCHRRRSVWAGTDCSREQAAAAELLVRPPLTSFFVLFFRMRGFLEEGATRTEWREREGGERILGLTLTRVINL